MEIVKQEIIKKILEDYLKPLSTQLDLSKKYHLSEYIINKILKKNNVKIKGRGIALKIFSKQDEQKMIELFNNGYNFSEISHKFDCDQSTIGKYLGDLGIKSIPQTILQRKYNINENFFENIDTQEKAYFLGWLLSDGSLSGKNNSFTISLQEKDKDVLLNLSKIISYTGQLKYKKGYRSKWFNNKFYISQPQFRLTITNKKIKQDLKKLNCFENKTFNLHFPNFIENDIINSFILGFWEGDGCLSFKIIKNRLLKTINIVGTSYMNIGIQQLLKDNNIKSYVYFPKNYKNGTTQLAIGELNSMLRFLNFIYKNTNFVMKRKFNKYINFIEIIKNSKRRNLDINLIIEAELNIERIKNLKN